MGADEAGTLESAFLLSLLSLFVLFFFIGCWLALVVRVKNFFSEFDAKLTFFDPGCFRFELDIGLFQLELSQDRILIDAWNHVRRFDEREREAGLEVDDWHLNVLRRSSLPICRWNLKSVKAHLDILEEATKSLLLWKNIQENVLSLDQVIVCIFAIVLESSLEIFFGLLVVAEYLIDDSTNDPELASILFGDGLQDIVQFCQGMLIVSAEDEAQYGVVGEFVNVQ